MSLPDLKCFDYILLESPKIRRKQVSSIYRFGLDGKELEFKLIHSYQEKIPRIEPFAKLMSIAPAVNYGLFTPLIRFELPLDARDFRFFVEMMNATFRDIFVNRIARRTGFVREEFVPRTVTPEMAEPMAKVEAEEITLEDIDFIQDYEKCAVMLSGGTESLLSMA